MTTMRCRVRLIDDSPQQVAPQAVQAPAENAEPGQGVRVTGMAVQRRIWTGGQTPVYITVTNYSSYEKNPDIILQDNTQKVMVGRQKITIAPLSSQVVTFNWKTRGFWLGGHVLHCEAITEPDPSEPAPVPCYEETSPGRYAYEPEERRRQALWR